MLRDNKFGTNTKPQRIINSLLNKLNISYKNEETFKYYSIDNYLTEYNLAIEVMGDFWHCHPLKYETSNKYDIHKKTISRDKAKHTYINKYNNIEILYLWESDIYDNLDVCEELIKLYITQNGKLNNYHSFNYSLIDGKLTLNNNLIIPYQDMINA